MSDSYLAQSPRAAQLDIIADTSLRGDHKSTPYITPGPKTVTGGDLSTAARVIMGGDLSTAPRAVTGGDLSTATSGAIKKDLASGGMKRLEAKRKELGLSISNLCLMAGIKPRTYQLALRGKAATRVATVRSIADTLRRFAKGEKPQAPRSLLEQMIRLMIVRVCQHVNVDPQTVFDTDFSSENTNDEKWLRSSRIRGAAIYLVVEGVGMSKAGVGHVVGITRQAVFKAVAAAELARDKDAEFDRIMRNMIVEVGNSGG